jgi:hypothetical protein
MSQDGLVFAHRARAETIAIDHSRHTIGNLQYTLDNNQQIVNHMTISRRIPSSWRSRDVFHTASLCRARR